MMSELTRLRDEAVRLLTIYEEHKDSTDEFMRRKAHVDLDRFLMEHRETAALLMVEGLKREIGSIVVELDFEKPVPWYRKIFGGMKNADSNNKVDKETISNV